MTKRKYASAGFPVERLWDLYDYNPLTGYLISKVGNYPGSPVKGYLEKDKSRWVIFLTRDDGSRLRTNYGRVVYAWVHGRWPEGSVDHVNRNPRDNRVWNLRQAEPSLQQNNTWNFNYGATWNKGVEKWLAQVRINGKTKYLGIFDVQKDAQEAFMRACDQIGRTYLEPTLVDGRYIPLERI